MGTNFYAVVERCAHCGRGGIEVHLGKRSLGWPFTYRFRKKPEDPVLSDHDLPDIMSRLDMIEFISNPNVSIRDENGRSYSVDEMIAVLGWGYDEPDWVRRALDDESSTMSEDGCLYIDRKFS